MLSRVGGLVRDAVFTHIYGAGAVADAFVVALTIPNTFRNLVAEGSLTVAFLPVFDATLKEKGEARAREVMASALYVFPLIGLFLTFLGIIFAGPLVDLFASGYRRTPGQHELTKHMTQIMFPYLAMISFVALAMGALNARRRFASSAASPVLYNIVQTIVMVLLAKYLAIPIYAAAIGVVLGGIAQVWMQIDEMKRVGLWVKPSYKIEPEVRRILSLMVPGLASLAVYQINIVALRHFGSYLPQGSITYLYAADRFVQLPLGVFSVAIATASLPILAGAFREGGKEGLRAVTLQSLRLTHVVVVPSTIALAVLAVPLVSTAFQHGAFTWPMTQSTAQATMAFAMGLVPLSGIRVFSQGFFAMQNTRAPVLCSVVGVSTNLIAAPLLAQQFSFMGLAMSVSLAAWMQWTVAGLWLGRHVGFSGVARTMLAMLRDAACAALMGLAVWRIVQYGRWEQGLSAYNTIILMASVLVGSIIYIALQLMLRGAEMQDLLQSVAKRFKRK